MSDNLTNINNNLTNIKDIFDDCVNLIKQNEYNKFIVLELFIAHAEKYILPRFVGYGLYSEVSDWISLPSEQLNERKNKLADDYTYLCQYKTDSINPASMKFINKICFDKIRQLVDSATGATNEDTDLIKAELRTYLQDGLNIPAFAVTGIFTECFYIIFKNAHIKVNASVFENVKDTGFTRLLKTYTYDTVEGILHLYSKTSEFI